MRPELAVGLAVAAFLAAGGGALLLARDRSPSAARRDPEPGRAPAGDPVVAPAYPFLDRWTSDARRALLDLQRELGLDPLRGGLAGVVAHESGGDPSAPRARTGTPRGGLIQLTAGANLPGFTAADAVWNVRNQDAVTQLRGVVRDYYRRQMPHGPPADQSAAALLRRNYLPALASLPSDHVLGVRPDGKRDDKGDLLPGELAAGRGPGGEGPGDKLPGGLTRGANYAANRGFDPAERGWFAWEDVDRQAVKAERAALARGWVRVSGARIPPGDPPVAGAEPAPAPAPPGDEDVFWHLWRYPPGTKVSQETLDRLAAESAVVETTGETPVETVARLNREDAERARDALLVQIGDAPWLVRVEVVWPGGGPESPYEVDRRVLVRVRDYPAALAALATAGVRFRAWATGRALGRLLGARVELVRDGAALAPPLGDAPLGGLPPLTGDEVRRSEPLGDGRWRLHLSGGQTVDVEREEEA